MKLCFLCQFSCFLLLTILISASSQSLGLPKKSASVPGDATADSAESCPASNVAAGDRQGEPRPAAGEEEPDLNNVSLLDYNTCNFYWGVLTK